MESYVELASELRVGAQNGKLHRMRKVRVTMPATQNYLDATVFGMRKLFDCSYVYDATNNGVVAATINPSQNKVLFFDTDGTAKDITSGDEVVISVRGSLAQTLDVGVGFSVGIGTGTGTGSGSGA